MHGRAESRGSTAAKAPQERSVACMAELKAEEVQQRKLRRSGLWHAWQS